MSRMQTPPPAVRQPLPMNTPSRVGTASRSSAQAPGRRPTDLKSDIKIDIKKTEKAGFDSFLRLFLSRCLHGDEQSKFESIQREIEGLQAERFDCTTLRQTSKGQEDESVLEVHPPNPRELELIEQRDGLLNKVLDQCLHGVLDIANNADIRMMLTEFANLIQAGSAEKVRYKPYADMYNAALRKLAELSPASLRPPQFPLCLSRADPNPIIASFFDSDEVTERKPDLVHTSVTAACATHMRGNAEDTNGTDDDANQQNIGTEPTTAFTWPQVLSPSEMKTFKVKLSDLAKEIEQQPFKSPGTEPHIHYIFVEPETPETVKEQSESGAKRRQCQANDNPSATKKARTSTTGTSTPGDTDSEKNIDARIQLAGYAMEMMSYGPGIAHVIGTLIIDEYLFVWIYDAQGSIRSEGISIIADFPRFLVLLLSFQRFTIEDWGIVPCLNPQALRGLGIDEQADVDLVKLSMDDNHFSSVSHVSSDICGPLEIQPKKYLSSQPHRLSGRMTTVLKASAVLKDSGQRVPLAFKISRPEVQRIPEGDVLRTAHAIAQERAPEMCNHLPKLYFSGDFRSGHTLRARSILNLNGKGHRTLRALVVNELQPLTIVTGGSFVKAWLDVVAFHAFLWKHGVQHGDPSLPNMLYDPSKQCGVLTDYDLSVMAWLKRVPGDDRTGTIPYMALDLLSDAYWNGYIERCYHHELEAFIWILSIVFLAYTNGKRNRRHKFTQDWFTSDYITCSDKKFSFLRHKLRWSHPSSDFTQYRRLMLDTCHLVRNQQSQRDLDRDHAVEDGDQDEEKDIDTTQDDTKESKIQYSEAMWNEFISILLKLSSIQPSQLHIDRLERHKPTFDISQCQSLFAQMQSIYKSVTETSQPRISATNPSSVALTT